MGYNTIISLKLADLDRIAANSGIGALLEMIAQRALSEPYRAHTVTAPDEGPERFSLTASATSHSSGTGIAILGPEGLSPRLDAHRNYPLPLDIWERAAAALSRQGHRVEALKASIRFDAIDPPEQTLENRIRLEVERRDAILADPDGAQASFILLNDALFGLKNDANIGERMRLAAHAQVKTWLTIINHAREGRVYGGHMRSFELGGISNGMSLIALTPAGRTDLVLCGGNYGRLIEPVLPLEAFENEKRKELLGKLVGRDVDELRGTLARAGFKIRRPGRSRSESAASWNEAAWVRDPEPAAPDQSGP